MAAFAFRAQIGLAFSLIAAACGSASAHEMKFHHAQVEPVAFDKLDGWKD